MSIIKVPFDKELVDNLNDYQMKGLFHPYTCCSPDDIPECKRILSYKKRREGETVDFNSENEGILVATEQGWICPCGKYKQDWCHDFKDFTK